MSSCGGRTDLQAQHRQQSCKRGLGGPVGSASGCGPGRPCLCTAGCVCVCGVHVEARCVGGAHGLPPGLLLLNSVSLPSSSLPKPTDLLLQLRVGEKTRGRLTGLRAG